MKKRKFQVVTSTHETKTMSKLSKKRHQELMQMAVDNDHYLFLVALEEGRITEKQYDAWAHSRKHEGPEVFRALLKRPYRTRDL